MMHPVSTSTNGRIAMPPCEYPAFVACPRGWSSYLKERSVNV